MHIHTKGLVIKETSAGESNRCVTLLTDKIGIITTFIKGAKSIRSRNTCASQLFSYSDFVIYKGRSGYIVNEADVKGTFKGLLNDITKLSLAQYFCEIALVMSPKEESAYNYLRLILNCLYYIEHDKIDKRIIKSIFEMRMCVMAGYMPNLVGCFKCGEYKIGDMYFSFDNSFLLCKDCIGCNDKKFYKHLKSGVSETMRHIVYAPMERLFFFKIPEDAILDISYITEKYLILNSYTEFKSLDFYKSLSV